MTLFLMKLNTVRERPLALGVPCCPHLTMTALSLLMLRCREVTTLFAYPNLYEQYSGDWWRRFVLILPS